MLDLYDESTWPEPGTDVLVWSGTEWRMLRRNDDDDAPGFNFCDGEPYEADTGDFWLPAPPVPSRPAMAERVNRILWNVRDKDIDEIVLHDATVHVEQMSDRCWWIGVTLPDGGYWAGNFIADSRGRMRFTEQEQWGFEWDRDDEHLGPTLTP